jgi:hypothetical protein
MLPKVAEILGRINGYYSRPTARCGNVYARDSRMGIVAAQESRVKHSGYFYVVHEQGLPGQETRVFGPCQTLTNVFLCHGSTPICITP